MTGLLSGMMNPSLHLLAPSSVSLLVSFPIHNVVHTLHIGYKGSMPQERCHRKTVIDSENCHLHTGW